MRPDIPTGVFQIPSRLASMLLAVGLALGMGAPGASAAEPPSPPVLESITVLEDDSLLIKYRYTGKVPTGLYSTFHES